MDTAFEELYEFHNDGEAVSSTRARDLCRLFSAGSDLVPRLKGVECGSCLSATAVCRITTCLAQGMVPLSEPAIAAMPESEIAALLRRVADAVAYAHAHGVAHGALHFSCVAVSCERGVDAACLGGFSENDDPPLHADVAAFHALLCDVAALRHTHAPPPPPRGIGMRELAAATRQTLRRGDEARETLLAGLLAGALQRNRELVVDSLQVVMGPADGVVDALGRVAQACLAASRADFRVRRSPMFVWAADAGHGWGPVRKILNSVLASIVALGILDGDAHTMAESAVALDVSLRLQAADTRYAKLNVFGIAGFVLSYMAYFAVPIDAAVQPWVLRVALGDPRQLREVSHAYHGERRSCDVLASVYAGGHVYGTLLRAQIAAFSASSGVVGGGDGGEHLQIALRHIIRAATRERPAVTRDSLRAALSLGADAALAARFDAWLHAAPPSALGDFVRVITESPTLAAGTRISVAASAATSRIAIHTCGFQLVLPATALASQAAFDECINMGVLAAASAREDYNVQ
jgi:hypothetical protein